MEGCDQRRLRTGSNHHVLDVATFVPRRVLLSTSEPSDNATPSRVTSALVERVSRRNDAACPSVCPPARSPRPAPWCFLPVRWHSRPARQMPKHAYAGCTRQTGTGKPELTRLRTDRTGRARRGNRLRDRGVDPAAGQAFTSLQREANQGHIARQTHSPTTTRTTTARNVVLRTITATPSSIGSLHIRLPATICRTCPHLLSASFIVRRSP